MFLRSMAAHPYKATGHPCAHLLDVHLTKFMTLWELQKRIIICPKVHYA